uniref:Uncharacterized protein n=1 Tax=Oryza glaberrima TaxID=4538 RepID=I1Q2H6_ORYGL
MAPPHGADRGPMIDDEIDESSETKIDEAATRRTAWSRPSTSRTRPTHRPSRRRPRGDR